jgi:hypothetical protein
LGWFLLHLMVSGGYNSFFLFFEMQTFATISVYDSIRL